MARGMRRLRDTGFWWSEDELDLRASGTINGGGVFAKRNISVDRAVVKIPKSGCITWRTSSLADTLTQAFRPRRVGPRGVLAEVPVHVKLILCLMHELLLGNRSPWAPYLATVPECEAGIPILWPKGEACELLRGTELDEHCQFKRLEIASEYRTHVQPLTQDFPQLFPLPAYSLAQYARKASLVSSRSFTIDSWHGPGMVPFADLFNHLTDGEHLHFTGLAEEEEEEKEGRKETEADTESGMDLNRPTASWRRDRDRESESFGDTGRRESRRGDESVSGSEGESEESECGDDYLIMESVRPVKKGGEVFNTYGAIGSAPLLVRYGFVDTDNSHDFVSLSERHLVYGTLLWAAGPREEGKTTTCLEGGRETVGLVLDLTSRGEWTPHIRLEFCRRYGLINEAGPGCRYVADASCMCMCVKTHSCSPVIHDTTSHTGKVTSILVRKFRQTLR